MSKWKEAREAEAQKASNKNKKDEVPSLEEFEKGMASDIDALHQAFRDRAKQEEKRFADVCDSDYYFVVCFSNNAQLLEFCDSVGLNPDEIYIDGRDFARKIRRALKTPDTEPSKIQPFNRDYLARAMHK